MNSKNKMAFYKRIQGLIPYEILEKLVVLIIGLGSGGSRVALHLARLGIYLILVERPGERLELHNVIRHALGLDSLGRIKVWEIAKCSRNYNPGSRTECHEIDVTKDTRKLAGLVQRTRPDLLLICTDNQESKHAVDAIAVRFGIPTSGAGVYDGGIGGEVYRTTPGKACYGCIADFLQLQRQAPKKTSPKDYNSLDQEEIRSTCALSLDIEQIALIQTRVALNALLPSQFSLLELPPEVNLLVFSNRRVPGVFERPLHCDFYAIPKSPSCLVCGAHRSDLPEADRILKSLGDAE